MLKALAANSAGGDTALDETPIDEEAASSSEDTGDHSVQLEQQMEKALSEGHLQSTLLGSRLAALSLSTSTSSEYRARPTLPRSSSQVAVSPSFTDPNDMVTLEPPLSDLAGDEGRASFDSSSSDEKLQAIKQEFGAIAELMEPAEGFTEPEPERILAESKGSLFKGVMLLGNLHLTTHRLLFHSLLPPESAMLGVKDGSNRLPDILMAGPVTWHREGPLRSSRRLWMEIGTEMLTTYPSGNDTGRVRPIQTILLSAVHRLTPFDPENPCLIKISHDKGDSASELSFHVDTEQSALQWRRSLEAALFRHARRRFRENLSQKMPRPHTEKEGSDNDEWTTLRCCIPLDRVHLTGMTHYHSFALLVGLEIDIDNEKMYWHPTDIAEGDFSGRITERSVTPRKTGFRLLHSRSKSSGRDPSPSKRASADADQLNNAASFPHATYLDSEFPPLPCSVGGNPSTQDKSTSLGIYDLNIAVLDEHAWFAEALQAAVATALERRYRQGSVRPRMKLEIAGLDCLGHDDEHDDHTRESASSDEQEDSASTLTRAIFKAEKAALAARTFGLRLEDGVYLKRCYLVNGMVPSRGHIILSRKYICFWRQATVGGDIKYRFPSVDIKGAHVCPSLRTGFHGLALEVHGAEDVRFEFWSKNSRKDIMGRIAEIAVQAGQPNLDTPTLSRNQSQKSTPPKNELKAEQGHPADILAPSKGMTFESRAFPDEALGYLPFVANKPFTSTARLKPRHFVCLTIGSRGDVQPYIALALRLMDDQHRVTIVTHSEFRDWIESYGIEHRQAGGDPTALMKLSAEHKMFSPGFFKESLGSFRQWLDDLLIDSWHACHDADVLIESPSTMAGVHIAEALKIPYFRAFTMPWTRTNAYPHAFMVPAFEMGPSFNYSTYVLFDSIMWRATAGQINRWRKKYLQVPATDMTTLSISKVPFLYNFSPAVVPKPLDWNDDISVTGYWHLENSDAEWSPPVTLVDFMERAKMDDRPLVYIGFGSIVVPDPDEMTRNIIAAVEKGESSLYSALCHINLCRRPGHHSQGVVLARRRSRREYRVSAELLRS